MYKNLYVDSSLFPSSFQVLGEGELSVKLNIKARAFSASAKEKLEAAGCSLTELPGRKKWVKPSVAKNIARADEYFAKKRAAAAAAAATSEPASAWTTFQQLDSKLSFKRGRCKVGNVLTYCRVFKFLDAIVLQMFRMLILRVILSIPCQI